MGFFDFLKPKRKNTSTRVVTASTLRSVSDRENQSYFVSAEDSSADSICSSDERSQLRAMCRKVLLDNSFALNAARSLALSVYGSGPSLQLKTGDDSLNTAIELLFNRWRKQTSYDVKFLTAIQALCSDGESFFLLYNDPAIVGGLNVELVEAYRIDNKYTEGFTPDTFDGIKYDQYNRPIEYSVLKVNPNPNYSQTIQYDVIPAERIEHLFIPMLAGQRRGLPLLQSALHTLASLKKLEDSTLAAAETAANLSFVVESDLDPNGDEQLVSIEGANGYEAFDTIRLPSRNTGIYLPSGMKVSQLKAEQPTTAYGTFRTDCLIGVGAAIGEPRNIVLNDSSSYNYSSARLDAQVFERWSATIQSLCVRILDSHFKSFIASMVDNIDVFQLLQQYSSIDDIPFRWYFPQPTHIDRQKEASADVLLMQNNCLSLRDFYSKIGRDWRSELQQIAQEKKMMQELGITPDDVAVAIQSESEKEESK